MCPGIVIKGGASLKRTNVPAFVNHSSPWSANNRLVPALLFALLLVAAQGCAADKQLRPFTTDGCSEFPDGTPSQKTLWRSCCIEHDRAYWLGGTYAERVAADKALQQCVASVGEARIGALMLGGVRVGGSPFWPTRFRWGYGWPWPRGYRSLTPEERAQVDEAPLAYEQEHGR